MRALCLNPLLSLIMNGHVPVLLREVLECLAPQPGERFLDGTFGGGGHTQALLDAAPRTEVVALDCDPEAVERGRRLELKHPARLRVVDANFRRLALLGLGEFDGVLLDLGVSSFQLDAAGRGFSFLRDGAADMRLDPRRGQAAAQFLESAPRARLEEAVRDFGEEPHWRRVVEAICRARGSGRLATTAGLAAVVESAIPARDRATSRVHPATRAFQGVRIAVNGELAALEEVLPAAFASLRPGGRLAVITFHSLEDRIVKRCFRRLCGQPESAEDGRPADLRERLADPLTRRPLSPAEGEVSLNPRSRSAKLRALRKLPA